MKSQHFIVIGYATLCKICKINCKTLFSTKLVLSCRIGKSSEEERDALMLTDESNIRFAKGKNYKKTSQEPHSILRIFSSNRIIFFFCSETKSCCCFLATHRRYMYFFFAIHHIIRQPPLLYCLKAIEQSVQQAKLTIFCFGWVRKQRGKIPNAWNYWTWTLMYRRRRPQKFASSLVLRLTRSSDHISPLLFVCGIQKSDFFVCARYLPLNHMIIWVVRGV